MSLDHRAPQAYAPLRLKQNEIEPFFKSVRERKVTRGYQPDTVKVVTAKPFEKTSPSYNNTNKNNQNKRKASKRPSLSSSSSSKTTKKKRKVLEKSLRDVTL